MDQSIAMSGMHFLRPVSSTRIERLTPSSRACFASPFQAYGRWRDRVQEGMPTSPLAEIPIRILTLQRDIAETERLLLGVQFKQRFG